MQIVLPDNTESATLLLDDAFNEEAYFAFCEANPDLNIERTAKGEIVIAPPAGGESDHRSLALGAKLYAWAKQDGKGVAFGSSVEFLLPNGAARSPDAAWVSNRKLAQLTKEQRRKFPRLVPDFVAEVLSPSDRLLAAKKKMLEWIENGVGSGWLIDGDAQTIYIYRAGQSVEKLTGIKTLVADGPLQGFTIKLADIWAGL